MFEDREEYIKAKAESKAKITKVIKIWNAREETIHDVAFQGGTKLGFQLCAKARLNVTSISDCPIKDEWHYVANDDLPKVDNKIVLCVCGDGYVDGKRYYTLKLLTKKEFSLFQPIYAWKEIILPKLNEEEEECI